MKYQKMIRAAWCLLSLSLAVSLTGCRVSLGGFLLGGKEEFTFSCREELPLEEQSPKAAAGNDSGGGALPASETAAEPQKAEEASPSQPEAPGGGITADGKVNLNTATLEELMTLNGVGETRAKAIVEYRTQNGPFTKEEDIMQIPGIKEGIYSKIQDQIVVH